VTWRLRFEVVGGGPSVRSLLLEQRDGTFNLVDWSQAPADAGSPCTTGASDANVSVRLALKDSAVVEYDPVCSALPVHVGVPRAGLGVNLSGGPIVLAIMTSAAS
jgi:hypothetical protein